MIKVEILDFCEHYKISIKKFLKESYGIFNNEVRNKIKHKDITGFINLIPVSIFFAYRYRDLVATGKLIIVEDDFHKYGVYINPRIICESYEIFMLKEELEQLDKNNPQDANQIECLLKLIRNLEENQRIINHFARKKQEQTNPKQLGTKRVRTCK